jgi:hypothetical protein
MFFLGGVGVVSVRSAPLTRTPDRRIQQFIPIGRLPEFAAVARSYESNLPS